MNKSDGYNFIKQLLIYAGVAAFFAILIVGARLINWNLGSAQQMAILVNLALGLGFIVYLRSSEYKYDLNPRINDKGALYWVCLCISLIVISSFYRPDVGWDNNISPNLWLIIETLLIAFADETVFRAFGDYCFPEKGLKEEAAMIICYAAYYLYGFTDGTKEGLMSLALAIGMGTLFTGLYLRYGKLGANIVYHFLLIYLMRLTTINSTYETVALGKAAPFIFALGVVGMVWYGLRLIQAYNAEGLLDDSELGANSDSFDLVKTFFDSREKYRKKITDKAEPRIEKNVERYIEKRNARAEKQEARREAKKKREKS